jgi:hypothetical protein
MSRLSAENARHELHRTAIGCCLKRTPFRHGYHAFIVHHYEDQMKLCYKAIDTYELTMTSCLIYVKDPPNIMDRS